MALHSAHPVQCTHIHTVICGKGQTTQFNHQCLCRKHMSDTLPHKEAYAYNASQPPIQAQELT